MKKFVMTAVLAGALAFAGSANAATFVYAGGLIKVGSRGSQVMDLQQCLADMGVNSSSNIDGIFGPITKAAVMSFQASKGVAVDGIIGPVTGPLYTAACAGAMDNSDDSDDDSDSDLSGGVGDITLTARGTYSSEEVGEGSEDVPVMAVAIEAGDDSDVRVDSVKIEFYQGNSADSRRLYKYADEVTVWFDGEKVGSADAKDFSESSNYYSKSIELDNVIIRSGDEEDLTFAVTALPNLDSGDIGTDDWSIDLLNVRFTDGDGVVTTTTADAAKADGSGTYEKDFNFASFATANDAELKLALGDDDINDANVLDADDSNDTEHDILSFTLDASGDSDIWVDMIPVVITTTGDDSEANIVINASLWVDGKRISDKEDVPNGGIVEFDDLDYTIDAGDEVEFILQVEMQDIDGALDDGDTVQATVTVASIDAEDEVGEAVTATGSAVGDAHTFYDNGIQVEFVGSSYIKNSSDTTGINETVQFTLEFDVTAFGDDMYVSDPCTADDATDFTTATTVYLSGDANHNNTTCSDLESTGDLDTTGNDSWEVKEGKTERFTVTVIGDGGEAGGAGSSVTFQAKLAGIAYTSGTAGNGDTTYNFDLANFKSKSVTIYDR